MKLIDKDALVAEIKARISDVEVSQKAGLIKKRDADKKMILFKGVLSLIDTFEVKEVDLEKEIDKWWWGRTWQTYGMTLNPDNIRNFAKHFLELGLKAKDK